MPQCKCKMCGGTISFSETDKTATCEFCGTEQTVVFTDNTKKMNLFNRANSLRLNNDFDKALATYENILIDDPNEVEAHWGICLCRYGIEYVDDPKTKKKIPTCHRTVFNSIFDDIDYKETIANADVVAKRLYQEEAEKIDKIQKTILAISQKEEPYDIFICYKETDNLGSRTRDSVIAQDIYDSLTDKGYKVFFARITLESKLGSEYEPIIFAALQSSKVMLVIGTKEEYFNAPWVKNEWSRFLGFMKEQRGKYLIPCYKDIDAYNMPEEFLALQSQNIDKLGFLQDLIRGIDKIFGRDKLEEKIVIVNNFINTNKLFEKVTLYLEFKDFENANFYCDKILENDPENASAYIYKLLCDLKLTAIDQLENCKIDFSKNINYIKATRYGDLELIKELHSLLEESKKNINVPNKNNFNSLNNNLSFANKKENNIKKTESKYEEKKVSLSSIKDSVTKDKKMRTLFTTGLILLLLYWPVGIAILIYRSVHVKKKVDEKKQMYIKEGYKIY